MRLRLLEDRDAERIRLWRNQAHIRMWYRYNKEIKPHEHRAWYEKYKIQDNAYLYIVETRESNWKPFGQLGIYKINWSSRSAEFGWILVGEVPPRGRGMMHEAAILLFEFWSDTYGIENYLLEVKADNERAIRFYKLLGFQTKQKTEGFLTMRLRLARQRNITTTSAFSLDAKL